MLSNLFKSTVHLVACIVAAMAILLPAPSFAQASLELTLSQAVEQVRNNNLFVEAESYAVAGAMAGVFQERGKFHPRFNFSLAHSTRGYETPSQLEPTREESARGDVSLNMMTPQGTTYEVRLGGQWVTSDLTYLVQNPYYQSEAAVTMVRPLLRGAGDDIAATGIDAALNNSRITKLGYEETVNNAVFGAVNLYWELYFARADLEVSEQSLALAENILDEVKERIRAGKLASIEVFQAESEVAQRQEVLIQARKAVRDSEDRLRGMMNLDSWEQEIVPVDMPPEPVDPEPLDNVLAEAFEKRTDYQRALLDRENKVRLKKYYESQSRPKLDLFATVSSTSVDEDEKDLPFDAIGLDTASWSAGLNYSKPLGGGEAQGQYMRAMHEEGKGRVLLEALTLEVKLSVREAYRNLTAAIETIGSTTTTRVAAEKRLLAEEEKFRVGKSTLGDVLQFQSEFTMAISREKRAQADYAVALAGLQLARGTLLDGNY